LDILTYTRDSHNLIGEDGVELINGWMKDATAWAQMAAEAVADGIPDERIKKQFLRMFTSGSMSYVRGECCDICDISITNDMLCRGLPESCSLHAV
jgi:hypothetical protein